MGLWSRFVELFSGMSIVAFGFIVVGLMLVIVEFFQSTRGVAAGCGAVMILTGIVLRMLAGGSSGTLFFMVLGVASVILIAHALMLILHKRDWSAHALSIAIADSESDDGGEKSYSFLMSLEGTTTTEVAPTGHMSINDVNFFVSADEPIAKGERVRVVEVDGGKIVVEKLPPPDVDNE